MDRREFLKGAAGITGLAALSIPLGGKCAKKRILPYNLYWGDMHCHSGISLGLGTLEDAFETAQEQRLDFCSVVGHSSWHDIPNDDETVNRIKDYITAHKSGHKKLADMWPMVKKQTREALKPGKFIPFLAFEWHSKRYGDHNVYYLEPDGEIVRANSIEELRDKMKEEKALIIPHHISYLPGSRGIDWDHFVESPQSPFVEVFSWHGCSMSDTAPYPNLREMGPRAYEGLIETGLKKGHKFGFMASTDNHYAYPGSYGQGNMAVYASELTQESLWDAFKARRVYAVTGDRIVIDFGLNDAFMGEELTDTGKREIEFAVQGDDFLDYVELVKNCKVIERFNPPFIVSPKKSGAVRAKIRFEWGWGVKTKFTEWDGTLSLSDGNLLSIAPCFRVQASSSRVDEKYKTLISRITEQNETSCSFHSYSYGNPTPTTPINNSIVLDVEMPLNASIKASVNGRKFEHTLAELIEGQRSHLIGGYLDVAVSFYKAVLEDAFTLNGHFTDSKPENPSDYYYLTVRQKNNQWAWSSPIWVSG